MESTPRDAYRFPTSRFSRQRVGVGLMLVIVPGLLVASSLSRAEDRADTASETNTSDSKTSESKSTEPSAAEIEFFEKRIRPLFVEHCQSCHGEEKQKGNFRLDGADLFRKGGDTGEPIDKDDPNASLLIEVLEYTGDYKMPPAGKLPADQIEAVREWVKRGAPWPRGKDVPAGGGGSAKVSEFDLEARKKAHWSFQPLHASAVPEPPADAPDASEIDRFLRARLTAVGLKPAPEADRRTLLRRVTFDLIGLPPSPAEVAEFLADNSPQAWERVIDRLLASPQYGERWGRHWLDLVRYAETCGHEFDFEIPQAYEYRDYVIRALNTDVLYDRFVMEHIAGDLLPDSRRNPQEGFNESLIGTGFWFLGEGKHSPVDIRADEAERVDNQVDVFGKTFLGLTLGCARCHDHKFDAISTKDYYALCGFLQSSRYNVRCADDPTARGAVVRQMEEVWQQGEALAQRAAQQTVAQAATRQPGAWLVAAARGLRAIKPEAGPERAETVARIAREAGLDAGELALWITELEQAAKSDSHPWRSLAQVAQAGRDEAAYWKARSDEARRSAETASARRLAAPFWDATVPESRVNLTGWVREGDAFERGRFDFRPDANLPGSQGGSLFSSLAVAPAAQGTLRSPTFEIREPFLLYRLSGTGARLNLIIDSHQLIRNPIYGGLTIRPDYPAEFRWHAQDVSKWIGHRAYIEFLDEGDGWIACAAAFPASSPGSPPAVNPVTLELLAEVNGFEELLTRARRVVDESLTGIAERSLFRNETISPASAAVGAWLLSSKLPGTPGAKLSSPEQAAQRAELTTARSKLGVKLTYRRKVLCIADGTGEDERVHLRGNPKKLGTVVPRRFLEAFVGEDNQSALPGSGRLELAQRMVNPNITPLVPRVIVNRVWQHHFGVGLVPTPDDFGNMGRAPTHPDLLDHLALKFVAEGWSLKKLHKALLLTTTYRQSSTGADPRAETVDPTNALLHKGRVQRLEGEAIRDAMLAVSGRLILGRDGRSTLPHLTPFMVGRGRPESGPLDGEGRRSVYLGIRRNFLPPMFLAFDFPVPFATMGRRSVSNVPAQALTLMNNPFVLEQARLFGERVLTGPAADDAGRLRELYERAFSRPPTDEELAAAREFLEEQTQAGGTPSEVWGALAHVLFNAKEFVFVN